MPVHAGIVAALEGDVDATEVADGAHTMIRLSRRMQHPVANANEGCYGDRGSLYRSC